MFHIGILQLTQNLDDAVRGFKQGLADAGLKAEFTYLNADGNVDLLPKLADKLQAAGVNLIFACTTPAARAAKELPGMIPVIFTPVFEPKSVGLVDNLAEPEGKVTGVCGMVKADLKVAFIKKLLPQLQKIGMLYHTGDENGLIEAANFRQAAAGKFELREIAVDNAADISLLGEKLPADIDALFLPIGRILEENFSSIAYYTDAVNLPIIASHAPNVVMGALGALVASHEAMGYTCGQMAKEILIDQKPIKEIPVAFPAEPEILLNQFAAENLEIELPDELTAKAAEIYN